MLDFALGQWSKAVRAEFLNGIELAVTFGNGDDGAVQINAEGFAFSNGVCIGNRYKSGCSSCVGTESWGESDSDRVVRCGRSAMMAAYCDPIIVDQ